MADPGASVLERLKNKAKEENKSYQQCLQLFFQEEFLRRVSKSDYRDMLILKGGLFIYTLTNFHSRATVDVDFLLRNQTATTANVMNMMNEILATPTGNDYIQFELVKTETISPQRKYQGITIQLLGRINKVRFPFDIDMGVGDVVVPASERRTVATQLKGFDMPEVSTYSLESTIAEKFDAMLQRLELTSRMKDFYDIYYLANTFEFDGERLKDALLKTLVNRGTVYGENSFQRIKALSGDEDINIRWRRFVKTVGIEDLGLKLVLDEMANFLEPVFMALILVEPFLKKWSNLEKKWDF